MQEPAKVTWHLYMIARSDGALYTGITTDVERRLQEHGGDSGKGAKALRGRGPLSLVLSREIGARETALRVERRIKKLSRRLKDELLVRPEQFDALVKEAAAAGSKRTNPEPLPTPEHTSKR
jgi:putative endonuclease